jgi:hypothetical protein
MGQLRDQSAMMASEITQIMSACEQTQPMGELVKQTHKAAENLI